MSIDGLLMSRGLFGCSLVQHGTTPRGLRTFALLEAHCSAVYWFGRRVGPADLLVFPTNGEIEAISHPGFCNHTFSLAEDALAEFFDRAHGPSLSRILDSGPCVIPLAPEHLERLRSHLRKISFDQSALKMSLALYDAYRDKLFSILLEILEPAKKARPSNRGQARRAVIKRVVDLLQIQLDQRYSLDDLCIVGGVPERTLNETFRKEVGMTPGAFVKGYQLYGAYRDLWHAQPSQVRVVDVANARGFWHMGQFAADYKRLFGERPSDTLRRSTMSAPR